MNVILKGQLLEVTIKEYDFEGQKGVSYKLNIYSDSKLYSVTIKKENVNEFQKLIGQTIEIECNLFVKGAYSLKLAE